jgi:F-type H+-transporting ATPase subunit delta
LISDILEHNNILILSDIAKHFEYLVETDSNLVNMTITSATELSAEEVAHIQSNIESQLNKKVDVRTETDKSLIGGVRLRVGNIVIDNTISRRLDMLKNTLTQA